jgi:hypothetical protein
VVDEYSVHLSTVVLHKMPKIEWLNIISCMMAARIQLTVNKLYLRKHNVGNFCCETKPLIEKLQHICVCKIRSFLYSSF